MAKLSPDSSHSKIYDLFFFTVRGLNMSKFIFVTGGVVSGLGKGITAASLGRLLKCCGLKVA